MPSSLTVQREQTLKRRIGRNTPNETIRKAASEASTTGLLDTTYAAIITAIGHPHPMTIHTLYPELSREEYLSQYKDRFIRTLRTWYRVWLVVGWGWPIAVMIGAYVVSSRPIVLASLALFLIVWFGVWAPIGVSRVCSRCTARELGICPLHLRAKAEGA